MKVDLSQEAHRDLQGRTQPGAGVAEILPPCEKEFKSKTDAGIECPASDLGLSWALGLPGITGPKPLA